MFGIITYNKSKKNSFNEVYSMQVRVTQKYISLSEMENMGLMTLVISTVDNKKLKNHSL